MDYLLEFAHTVIHELTHGPKCGQFQLALNPPVAEIYKWAPCLAASNPYYSGNNTYNSALFRTLLNAHRE